jgi:Tfp pilus assembly pilus retraction ATPase PilT
MNDLFFSLPCLSISIILFFTGTVLNRKCKQFAFGIDLSKSFLTDELIKNIKISIIAQRIIKTNNQQMEIITQEVLEVCKNNQISIDDAIELSKKMTIPENVNV